MSQTKAQLVGGVGISTVGDLSVYGGVNATGVITATSFSGDGSGITGVSSVSFATTSYVLAGTPNITVGFITATGASISGNVTVGGNVSIAGTLTYEDVTNVDSIGIVTARAGVNVTGGSVVVGSAVTLSSGGITVGVVTATRVSVAASVTATNFYGDGSQLSGVSVGTDITSSLFT